MKNFLDRINRMNKIRNGTAVCVVDADETDIYFRKDGSTPVYFISENRG